MAVAHGTKGSRRKQGARGPSTSNVKAGKSISVAPKAPKARTPAALDHGVSPPLLDVSPITKYSAKKSRGTQKVTATEKPLPNKTVKTSHSEEKKAVGEGTPGAPRLAAHTPAALLAVLNQTAAASKATSKRSASPAGLHNEASEADKKRAKREFCDTQLYRILSEWESESHPKWRSIEVINFPNELSEKILKEKLMKLLNPQDVTEFENIKGKRLKIGFNTIKASLSAKKLNGVLLENRHISVLHKSDVFLLGCNKVVVENLSEDFKHEDIYKNFGVCGKIYALKKLDNRWLITFETKAAKQRALRLYLTCEGKDVIVSDFVPEVGRTVYLSNLPKGVGKPHIVTFVEGVGPVESVDINEETRQAQVVFKISSSLPKILALHGALLKGSKVELLVCVKTYLETLVKDN